MSFELSPNLTEYWSTRGRGADSCLSDGRAVAGLAQAWTRARSRGSLTGVRTAFATVDPCDPGTDPRGIPTDGMVSELVVIRRNLPHSLAEVSCLARPTTCRRVVGLLAVTRVAPSFLCSISCCLCLFLFLLHTLFLLIFLCFPVRLALALCFVRHRPGFAFFLDALCGTGHLRSVRLFAFVNSLTADRGLYLCTFLTVCQTCMPGHIRSNAPAQGT